MKLGKKQREWVEALRNNPEQQCRGKLGAREVAKNKKKFCCLGKSLEILGKGEYNKFNQYLEKSSCNNSVLQHSYKEIGLKSEEGRFKEPVCVELLREEEKVVWIKRSSDINTNYLDAKKKETNVRHDFYYCLAEMNDGKMTWPQIADYLESYPENVFVKSV